MTENVINHVCLIMAMEGEAMPLLARLGLDEKIQFHARIPAYYYQKRFATMTTSVVLIGKDERFEVDWVGTELATLTTHLALDALRPDLVIATGTAGGFTRYGSDIGSICLSDGPFMYHDHHVPLMGFDQSAIGDYPSVDVSGIAKSFGWQLGTISTGSSLRKTNEDIAVLNQRKAIAKDMESTAVAGVCMLHNTPCFALRSITNLVDEDNNSEDEFSHNFSTAVASLSSALLSVLDYLEDKSIEDLAL